MNESDRCPGTNRLGEQCGHPQAWGVDGKDSGPCKFHGGASNGAPEGNTNAVTHGAYADANSYYQHILDDQLRGFVDQVFTDYLERYRELHGDPVLGIEAELFRVSVTHAKDIGLDRWADEKPEGLESGHPLVDKETNLVPIGEGQVEVERSYRESVVLAAQRKLSSDRRQWLKDLGLLQDPDEDGGVVVNVHEELLSGLKAAHQDEPEQ